MSAPIQIDGWRGRGCGPSCLPRSHDPAAHEAYGWEMALASQKPAVVRTGALTVDLERGTVHVEGLEISVTGREWDVLAYLAERCGQNCRSDDIARAVWGPGVNPSANVRCLNVTSDRLRKRLGPAAVLLKTPRWKAPSLRRLDLIEPTTDIVGRQERLTLVAQIAKGAEHA